MAEKITTFLMFEGKAEEAMDFYVSLFPNSERLAIERYGPDEMGTDGAVKMSRITVNGLELMCFDSPVEHPFTFTPSISLFVECESDEEIVRLFEKLSDGGEVMMPLDKYPFGGKFAWVSDKFGVSWQLRLDAPNS